MTKDCKETFTRIYKDRVWGDGSGGGSGEQAQPYCDFVSERLFELGMVDLAGQPTRRVLDIGCGDGRVAARIEWNGWEYIGVDAAQGFDALTDPLPEADLVLCKEVMQHLSNEQIQLLLDRTAHYPRRLFTNTCHPSLPVNTDITTGDCRAVDLTLAPFNQPARTVFRYGHWIVQELTTP